MKIKYGRIFLVVVIIVLILIARKTSLSDYLTFSVLKENVDQFRSQFDQHPIYTMGIYFAIYTLVAGLSLPGAVPLTLAGGAIFGLWWGTVIVSFASTLGATLAFLTSRFVIGSYVQKKYGNRLHAINEGMRKEGKLYLFSLRLIPVFPFFLINLAMGLTAIPTWTYLWVSQVGMLAGTLVYINAGLQIANITSVSGILSPFLILSFVLLGILPFLSKGMLNAFKVRKVYAPYVKPKTFDYNMVVIGAGSAGLVTSYICAATKAKVALVEREKMGGDCLNTGCVPSKAILRAAKIIHYSKRAEEFGIKRIAVEFDFAKLMETVHGVVKTVEPHDSTERYKSLGVDCFKGEAMITSPWEVRIGSRVLTTRSITIAAGASPFVPQFSGLEKIEYLTSDTLWSLRELPRRLLILGGGPIGCEMGQCFARLGSEVTIVMMHSQIMVKEDKDVAKIIEERFHAEGIRVLTDHTAIAFQVENDRKYLVCEYKSQKHSLEFDRVFIALGRKPRVTGYGLEQLGIEVRKDGTIVSNAKLQTRFPNIFACGDVTGPFQLTHVSAYQAWFSAVNGLFGKLWLFDTDYTRIPWCTFTDPEVATVGYNEASAKKHGIDYTVTIYNLSDLDRAIADHENVGFVKVLTVPKKDKILGATIVCQHASDMILEFVTAIHHGIGLNKILQTIHIYPTYAEANRFVAGEWKKKNVSERSLQFLEKYHRWMRATGWRRDNLEKQRDEL
jgi:pyruvate/2-oxoglutarate dehydrogenase complex dihydrolipoamide dehydrogenase (E3) component/uncharacterized membrane protein YdjX (TVP38/TMEM64 family)